MCHPPGD